MPKRERLEGSYSTTGVFFARFRGSRESGRSMMIVWVLETPKSCIIFAEPIPGTGVFRIRVCDGVFLL